MAKKIKKAQTFCFTRYEMKFDYEAVPTLRYICMGREVAPTTGREHWQGWCMFHHNITRALAARRLGVALDGCQIMKGTVEQNDTYCRKEGKTVEWGKKPRDGQGRRSDLETYLQRVQDGATEEQLLEEAPATWAVYGRRGEAARALMRRGPRPLLGVRRTWNTEVRVWWGSKTGTGKTRAAVAWLTEAEGASYDDCSQSGNFLIGYTNNENVLIDDFSPMGMTRSLFLRMTDRYQVTINCKYKDDTQWNPKKLAITSNYNPITWYTEADAVMRRLDHVTHIA